MNKYARLADVDLHFFLYLPPCTAGAVESGLPRLTILPPKATEFSPGSACSKGNKDIVTFTQTEIRIVTLIPKANEPSPGRACSKGTSF
jgi:hypothetical protein